MAKHTTRKAGTAGKHRTIARRQVRHDKYRTTELDTTRLMKEISR